MNLKYKSNHIPLPVPLKGFTPDILRIKTKYVTQSTRSYLAPPDFPPQLYLQAHSPFRFSGPQSPVSPSLRRHRHPCTCSRVPTTHSLGLVHPYSPLGSLFKSLPRGALPEPQSTVTEPVSSLQAFTTVCHYTFIRVMV